MKSKYRDINRDTKGVAAVEFAIVLPILLTLALGILEGGLLFQLQNTMTHHAREIVREVALGNMTGAEAETELSNRLTDYAVLSYTVTIVEPDPNDPDDTDVVATVTAPQSEVKKLATLGVFVFGDGLFPFALEFRIRRLTPEAVSPDLLR